MARGKRTGFTRIKQSAMFSLHAQSLAPRLRQPTFTSAQHAAEEYRRNMGQVGRLLHETAAPLSTRSHNTVTRYEDVMAAALAHLVRTGHEELAGALVEERRTQDLRTRRVAAGIETRDIEIEVGQARATVRKMLRDLAVDAPS